MENHYQFADTMNFTASEFALGRERCRKWVSLITQQLRLRHIYQIYAYNIPEDRKAKFFFTLHNSPMSAPFYTSEKVAGKNPKWQELLFGNTAETNVSSVVIRVWKSSSSENDVDQMLLTWGVNFTGLVYLGNKIADIQPKYFKANTVIFFMQGVYFTSQEYIRNDLEQRLPFQKNLNLVETLNNKRVLYRKVAVNVPKGEVANSYTLEKLRRLQDLQRQIKNKKIEVQHIKEKIKSVTEREPTKDLADSQRSSYNSSNVRFAPQLLTMNHLNKMLHAKPTKAEREAMIAASKKMELCRFRLRLLHQERDKKMANLRRLKQLEIKLGEENEEKNSNLMSLYHTLSKESQQRNEYKHALSRRKDLLAVVNEQIRHRQQELLRELLFIYPIEKLPNAYKYTMLGIHLPDSEQLLDYQDPGVSVVFGYICHILVMCSIFLQVPLRYPMKHLGSRSVIYNDVFPDWPNKEREFPLYTKGKDRADFSYAVFLLNKNIAQLRWHLHHKFIIKDLKETLKHLRSLLLGDDSPEFRHIFGYLPQQQEKRPGRPLTTGELSFLTADSAVSLDKLISPSVSSMSSSNLNDPLLDRIHEELRRERLGQEPPGTNSSPKKKLTAFKSTSRHAVKKTKSPRGTTSRALAISEAYLSKQISKDAFYRFATEGCKLGSEENVIKVREGVEEVRANEDPNAMRSDSIEEGTDPLDPATNLDSLITKSIDIQRDQTATSNRTISRSVDSYVDAELSDAFYKSCEIGSDPMINVSCDKNRAGPSGVKMDTSGVASEQRLLEQWLAGDPNLTVFPEECLRMSLQDISSPLVERTDRLLSTKQSFNLVKHRPME